MSSRFFYRRRAERFAQLLDEANGGRRHHFRSRVDGDLVELLAVGRRVREMRPAVEVSADFRTSLRAMLVATAERDGIGASANPEFTEDTPRTAQNGSGHGLFPGLGSRQVRARGAILVGVAAGAIAVSGMSAASEHAVPGDALYTVKRSTERAQLALASSDLSRGQLFLDFAKTRLAEANAVRGQSEGFTGVLSDMDADIRQGVKLLTTAAVQRKDEAALDAIGTFLASQRDEVSALLDAATPDEYERTNASLDLLDSVKRRADGLRATLRCGATITGRGDALGPLPQPCPTSKSLPGTQPSTSPTPGYRSGGRAPEPNRAEANDPGVPPAFTPPPLGAENAPELPELNRPETDPRSTEPGDTGPAR